MLFTRINYFLSNAQDVRFYCQWVGVGGFSKVVATSNHVGGAFNTLRPRQNGRHFADDIFKCIFLIENIWIPIKISLKFVPQG